MRIRRALAERSYRYSAALPPRTRAMQPLLDAIADYLPSPLDMPPMRASTPRPTRDRRKASPTRSFPALVFKIKSDPFVGKLAYARIYSGTLTAGRNRIQSGQGLRGAYR